MSQLNGTKQRDYSLTPAEIKYYQSHKLSFRSLSGGFFRCNQVDRFGKLTKTAVVGIQGQLTKHGHSVKKAVQVAMPTTEEQGLVVLPPPKGSWDAHGSSILCPRCGKEYEYWHLKLGDKNFCTACKMPFQAPTAAQRPGHSAPSRRGFAWW